MIQKFLRQQPPALQFMAFLFLWSLMTILSRGAFTTIMQLAEGHSIDFKDYLKNPDHYPAATFAINLVYAILVFLVPATLFARLISDQPGKYLGFSGKGKYATIPWIVILGLCMMLALPAISSLLQQIGLGESADELQKKRQLMEAAYFKGNGVWIFFRNLALLAFVPALCEEVFFRGIIQRFAFVLTRKKSLALVISAVVFSLEHGSVYNFLPIFLAGLLLGWIYFATGDLKLNILLHFFYNATQISLMQYAIADPEFEKLTEQSYIFTALLPLAGVLLAAMCIFMIRRHQTPLTLFQLIPQDKEKQQ